MKEIPNLRLAVKLAKETCIKLVHQFIFGNDESRKDRENLCNFKGFKFKIDGEEFGNELTEVLENFNKVELIQIANFLQRDIKDTEEILPIICFQF